MGKQPGGGGCKIRKPPLFFDKELRLGKQPDLLASKVLNENIFAG
jgi:hypothetical protein